MFTAHPALTLALQLLGLTPGVEADALAWQLAIVWSRRTMWRSATEETAVVAMALALDRGDRRAANHWAAYVVDERRAVARAAAVEAAAEGVTAIVEWPVAEGPSEPPRRPRPPTPPAPAPAPAPARRPRGKDFSAANARLDARMREAAPSQWSRVEAWRSVAGKGIERCSDVGCLCGYPKTLCRSAVAAQKAVA